MTAASSLLLTGFAALPQTPILPDGLGLRNTGHGNCGRIEIFDCPDSIGYDYRLPQCLQNGLSPITFALQLAGALGHHLFQVVGVMLEILIQQDRFQGLTHRRPHALGQGQFLMAERTGDSPL